jgi:mRNA interferase MazF
MTGLPVASVIRAAKIATIEATDATKLGRVSAPQLRQAIQQIFLELGGSVGRGMKRR